MKAFKIFFVALIATLSLGFTACSDDDKNGSSSGIVGTWSWSDGEEYSTYIFNTDNSFSCRYWDKYDTTDYGYMVGTYYYNEDLQILRMEGVDEEGDYDSYYVTCKINGNTMTWYETDGDSMTLTRTK